MQTQIPFKTAVVICSDKGAQGEREDRSGMLLAQRFTDAGFQVTSRTIVPDEREEIAALLKMLCDVDKNTLILTTGGTGLSPRDVTPEATLSVIEKRVPGIEEALRAYSMSKTDKAMLSRSVCGIRGQTLIINMPGSVSACRDYCDFLLSGTIARRIAMDAVILAAGTSSRFGSENKLLAEVSGKPMFLHITEILASLQRSSRIDEIVLVTNDPAIEDIVKRQYPLLRLVRNDHPEKGLALSMKLGILHLMRRSERIDRETSFERKRISEGCLFTVADQPYMTEETIQRLLNSWRLCGVCLEELLPGETGRHDPLHECARGPFANTAIAACEGSHGPCNPVVFSGCYYKEILDLPEAETGGRALLQRYKDRLCLVPAQDRELFDIDSKGDLDV